MSYRYRFIKTKKKTLKYIASMTPDEFIEWARILNIVDESDDYRDFNLHRIGEEFFDLTGIADVQLINQINSMSTPLFTDPALTDEFEHYEPYMAGPEVILPVIQALRNKIVAMYEELLLSDEEHFAKTGYKIPQWHRHKEHIERLSNEWKPKWGKSDTCFAIDIHNRLDDGISNSGRFEYSVFELAHQLKSTDWDEYGILFMGW